MIQQLETLITQALSELGHTWPSEAVITEPPPHVKADFAVNVALQVAQALKVNPRQIAEQLREKLMTTGQFTSIEIAGPGFLNLELTNEPYVAAFDMLQGEPLAGNPETPKKVVVEYISANPTGPLHIGNARGGPIGETISRVLEARGHQVHRDFYVNNVGGQANVFAASVLHYYKLHFGAESVFPEKGYPAPYVQELATRIAEEEGDHIMTLPEFDQVEAMRVVAITRQVEQIKATAKRMGISFDTWSNQSDLVVSGRSAGALAALKEHGSTFEKDGAVWLSGTDHEDDRETVLVKSDGTTTYFLDDIAFYRMKFEEWGNDFAVCVLGPGHVDHISRMKAGLIGIGLDAGRYHGTIYQHVQLKENGEKKKMAKREGTFVTTDEVLDDIPRDAFTWFMLSKAAETHLDFDLQLAKDTSEKNPTYYVQYAHARICSVLARAGDAGTMTEAPVFNPEERSLIRHLANFAPVVQEVAETYRTHLIPNYLFELATRYHHFYAHHRVMADDPALATSRLAISSLTAAVLKEGLRLMNIEAPEHMSRAE